MPTHRRQGNTNVAASQDASLAAEQSFLWRTEIWGKEQEARRHITLLMVSRQQKDGFLFCICSKLCSLLSRAKPCRVAFTTTRQGELVPCRAKGVRQHPISYQVTSHPQSPAPLPRGMCKSAGEGRQDTGLPSWSRGSIRSAPRPSVKSSHCAEAAALAVAWWSPEWVHQNMLRWNSFLAEDWFFRWWKWMLHGFNMSIRSHMNLEISTTSSNRIVWQYSQWINPRQVDLLLPSDRSN